MNRFLIITTVYNVEHWLDINLSMLKHQTHKDFLCCIVNDHSNDGSKELANRLIGEDNRFCLIDTDKPQVGQGGAFIQAMEHLEKNFDIDDEDVIVEVDGDDWLSDVWVLEKVSNVYNLKANYWMTEGAYKQYPTNETGGHYNMKITDFVDKHNLYREQPFPYSHLKTYKYFLYNKINKKDLIDPATGKYFRNAWDHALCLPMVEMAGKSRIYKFYDILYILNRSDDLNNEGKNRLREQKETEHRIRQLKPYDKIGTAKNLPKIKNVESGMNLTLMNYILPSQPFKLIEKNISSYSYLWDKLKTNIVFVNPVEGKLKNLLDFYEISYTDNIKNYWISEIYSRLSEVETDYVMIFFEDCFITNPSLLEYTFNTLEINSFDFMPTVYFHDWNQIMKFMLSSNAALEDREFYYGYWGTNESVYCNRNGCKNYTHGSIYPIATGGIFSKSLLRQSMEIMMNSEYWNVVMENNSFFPNPLKHPNLPHSYELFWKHQEEQGNETYGEIEEIQYKILVPKTGFAYSNDTKNQSRRHPR